MSTEIRQTSEIQLNETSWRASSNSENVWIKRDRFGIDIKIDFKRVLSNGTFLTSKCNKFFFDAISASLGSVWNNDGSGWNISSEKSLKSMFLSQYMWIYWLVSRGHSSFEFVDEDDVLEYMRLILNGCDAVFNSNEKIKKFFKKCEIYKVDTSNLSVSEILDAVCIPSTSVARLPIARATIENYRKGVPFKDNNENENKISASGALMRGYGLIALHEMSSRPEHKLSFNPRDMVAEAIAYYGVVARGTTRLLPMPASMALLESAALWVIEVAPILLRVWRHLTEIVLERNKYGRAEYLKKMKEVLNRENPKLEALIGYGLTNERAVPNMLGVAKACRHLLPSACFIIISALTARRCVEVTFIERGACKGTKEFGYWIKTYVAKTLKHYDFTPCSTLVLEAVQIMEELSSVGALKSKDKDYVFYLNTFSSRKFRRQLQIPHYIKEFCDFSGISNFTSKDEAAWVLAPHQLRKMFAVLYVWRYDAGDLNSLSYHLRHFDLRMTIKYCGERDLYDEIDTQSAALTEKKLKDIATRAIGHAGAFGKKLTKLIENILPDISFCGSAEIDSRLSRLVRERKLSLKATPWGFCGASNSTSNIRRAQCQGTREVPVKSFDGRPDPTASDEFRCSKCLFFVADTSRLPHWDSVVKNLENEAASPSIARLKAIGLRRRLQTLQSFADALARSTS